MNEILEDIKKHLMNLDWILIAIVIVCTGYGLLLIKSATNPLNTAKYVGVQGMAMLLGICAMLVVSKIDYYHILKYTKFMYALAIMAMVAVIFFGQGEEETGRGSWFRFFGVGIQPSEMVKFLYIVCLAKQINSIKENPSRLKNVILLVLYAGVIIGLVVSDNMGSGLVYIFIFCAMFFVAGGSVWYFVGVGAVAVASAPYLWNFLQDYQRNRILHALKPELDPLGVGYQVLRSKDAIGSGGLFGSGFQQGYITQNKILPKQYTDFIFATAGEEFGFLGATLVMIILIAVIARIFYVSRQARNDSGSLICIGVMAMFIAQIIVNLGMCLGLMPVIGVTLPFFSYGGSSILSCYLAIGLVLSVYSRRRIYYFTQNDDILEMEDDYLP